MKVINFYIRDVVKNVNYEIVPDNIYLYISDAKHILEDNYIWSEDAICCLYEVD